MPSVAENYLGDPPLGISGKPLIGLVVFACCFGHAVRLHPFVPNWQACLLFQQSRNVTLTARCGGNLTRVNASVGAYPRVVLTVVAALTGACGSSLSGAPKAGEIDIRQLNAGNYSVEPVTLPSPPGVMLPRGGPMADAVATVIDVDPTLEFQEAGVVDDPESAANVLSFIPEIPVIKPVLRSTA